MGKVSTLSFGRGGSRSSRPAEHVFAFFKDVFGATPAGTDEAFFYCGGMSQLHGGSAVSTILNWEIGTKSCFIEPLSS